MSAPRLSLPKRVAYTVVIWLMALCVAEIGLRLFWTPAPDTVGQGLRTLNLFVPDAELGWLMQANFRGMDARHGGSAVETNSLGFRDVEHDLQPGARPRVVALGDSFVFGDGVRAEDRFTDLLARRLGVEMINFGVSRYDTHRELMVLRRFGLAYKPQAVLLAFCQNDATYHDHDPFLPPVVPPPPRDWLGSLKSGMLGRVQLYALLREVVNSRRWLARPLVALGLKQPPPGYEALNDSLRLSLVNYPPELQQDWSRTLAALAEIKAICDEHGIRLVIAAVPALQAIESDAFEAALVGVGYEPQDFDLAKPYRLLEEFCAEQGIPYVNGYPEFQGKRGLYLPQDLHFTPQGHRLFADAIAPTLEKVLGNSNH